MGTEHCKDDFTANATTNVFSRTCCTEHKDVLNDSLVFSKGIFVIRKCCVYAVKSIVVMTPKTTNTKRNNYKKTLDD